MRIDFIFINDAGQKATKYYYLKDNEYIVFTCTIKNGNQFIDGNFKVGFYDQKKEVIFDICKSVHKTP